MNDLKLSIIGLLALVCGLQLAGLIVLGLQLTCEPAALQQPHQASQPVGPVINATLWVDGAGWNCQATENGSYVVKATGLSPEESFSQCLDQLD